MFGPAVRTHVCRRVVLFCSGLPSQTPLVYSCESGHHIERKKRSSISFTHYVTAAGPEEIIAMVLQYLGEIDPCTLLISVSMLSPPPPSSTLRMTVEGKKRKKNKGTRAFSFRRLCDCTFHCATTPRYSPLIFPPHGPPRPPPSTGTASVQAVAQGVQDVSKRLYTML